MTEGLGKSDKYDLFYTKPEIALRCVNETHRAIVENGDKAVDYTWIDPCAGAGVFSWALEVIGIPSDQVLAYDTHPRHPDVMTQDFFDIDLKEGLEECIIFGNPPFGKQSKLASAFLQKAIDLNAEYIAFILPSGFRSIDIYNRCCATHTRILCLELPEHSFVSVDGVSLKNTCVFCIFKKGASPRKDKELCKDLLFIGSSPWNIHHLKTITGGWDLYLTGSWHTPAPEIICDTSPDVLEQRRYNKKGKLKTYRYRAVGLRINRNIPEEDRLRLIDIIKGIHWPDWAVKYGAGIYNINKEQIHKAVFKALPDDLRWRLC